MKDGVFETMFPLHEVRGDKFKMGLRVGTRGGKPSSHGLSSMTQGEKELKRKWARWRNMFRKQPIDDIR